MRYSTRKTLTFCATVASISLAVVAVGLFFYAHLLDRQQQSHRHLERAAMVAAEINILRENWEEHWRQLTRARSRLRLIEEQARTRSSDAALQARRRAAQREAADWERRIARDEAHLRELMSQHRREIARAQ